MVNPADRHRKRTISSDFSMAGQIVNTDMTTLAGYFFIEIGSIIPKSFQKIVQIVAQIIDQKVVQKLVQIIVQKIG